MAQNARKQRESAPDSELEAEEMLESDVDAQEGNPKNIGEVMGSSTGEGEDVIAAGGWAGTDDDTSTAPSDRIGLPVADDLAELTGGAISDKDPMIEGETESPAELGEAIQEAEDRILNNGRRPGPAAT